VCACLDATLQRDGRRQDAGEGLSKEFWDAVEGIAQEN
jgi:hypothetical protein